jgi:hypothetical protein
MSFTIKTATNLSHLISCPRQHPEEKSTSIITEERCSHTPWSPHYTHPFNRSRYKTSCSRRVQEARICSHVLEKAQKSGRHEDHSPMGYNDLMSRYTPIAYRLSSLLTWSRVDRVIWRRRQEQRDELFPTRHGPCQLEIHHLSRWYCQRAYRLSCLYGHWVFLLDPIFLASLRRGEA